jgi:hypothetical protein
MFCYFLDNGPSSIDVYLSKEPKERPDLTAVRLMTKSTAMVRGDSTQQVEQSIINQLSGPDIYPVDTKYRMVWYNWLITNRFANDPRIKKAGAMAGIYCIYKRKDEEIVRNSLKIIERILKNISLEFKSIDDIIRRKLKFSSSKDLKQSHFSDFIKNKDSSVITKKISNILNEKVQKYSITRVSRNEKFKIILQATVFNKGTPEEIFDKSEKRKQWNSIINKLDRIINSRIPSLNTKKALEKDLNEVFHLLTNEKIWSELRLKENTNPIIQDKDIADFFFYYWLTHHQLLKKKNNLQLYMKLTN